MKDRWKNNLGLKILAGLFAFFLWWAVVNVDDPIQSESFKAQVILLNTDVITNTGMTYQVIGTDEVTVTVKARRKALQDIGPSDIIATADFREINEETQLIPIRVDVKGHEYKEAVASPRNLQVKTEKLIQKNILITVKAMGSLPEGYEIDETNTTAVPKVIEISGPESVVNRLHKVEARFNASGITEDTSAQAQLVYLDSAGNRLDERLLSSSLGNNGVLVNIKLLRTKDLEIRFDTSKIKVPDGYTFTGIEVEPKTIKIAGIQEDIMSLTYLDIASEALQLEVDPNKNEPITVDLTEYLPENLKLAKDAAGELVSAEVAVSIQVHKSGSKSLDLPVRSIKIDNLGDGLEVDYGDLVSVKLQFSGTEDGLEKVTTESVEASIDMSQYKEGIYSIPVQVTKTPPQCSYLGGTSVEITVKKKG